MRGVYQSNMELDIYQETKKNDGIYTRGLARYSVVTTDASIQHRGRVAVFYRLTLHFAVEAVQKFVPNVIVFHLAMGEQR